MGWCTRHLFLDRSEGRHVRHPVDADADLGGAHQADAEADRLRRVREVMLLSRWIEAARFVDTSARPHPERGRVGAGVTVRSTTYPHPTCFACRPAPSRGR